MPDSSEVLIGLKGGDHVLLYNWRHGHEGWTYADADVLCGVWKGGFRVSFYSNEHVKFAEELRQLYQDLSGIATLKPIDNYLEMTFTGDGRGGVEIEGRAQSLFGIETYLCFSFSIDQTFLPKIADGLSAHVHPSPETGSR